MFRILVLRSDEYAIERACIDDLIGRSNFSVTQIDTGARPKVRSLVDLIDRIDADVLLLPDWSFPVDRALLLRFRQRGGLVVVGMSEAWTGRIAQRLKATVASNRFHRFIDILWVPGERERQYGEKCGYHRQMCWSGFLTCDWHRFAKIYEQRKEASLHGFLYIKEGALDGGFADLLKAYGMYRASSVEPLSLTCLVTDELSRRDEPQEGVTFVRESSDTVRDEFMANASAMVLPGRTPSWGSIMHQATSAGMPIITTDAYGASVHLLQPRYNGLLFRAGDRTELVRCLREFTSFHLDVRDQMGLRSYELSKQFSPTRWAKTICLELAYIASKRTMVGGDMGSTTRRNREAIRTSPTLNSPKGIPASLPDAP